MGGSGVSSLVNKHCVPCRGGIPPLRGEALIPLLAQISYWNAVEEHHLSKTFLFADFMKALEFLNRVGELAEQEGHHPDMCIAWGRVDVKIYTHKIDGLSENDFILAAKIDQTFFQR